MDCFTYIHIEFHVLHPKRDHTLFLFQNHYIMATILEAGSYSHPVQGRPGPDQFFVDQVKVTLSQLDADDADIEIACNERLVLQVFFKPLSVYIVYSFGQKTI